VAAHVVAIVCLLSFIGTTLFLSGCASSYWVECKYTAISNCQLNSSY